ncbi:hypothetical protein [Paenibacillus kribbensis]|uniref:hypothetical protein n=1 Tax=Paenibacillus kribbensis TaxID=172713 RepID=UPI00114CA66D|nr:hypothetical protein [Paenibacillus kribbensis]
MPSVDSESQAWRIAAVPRCAGLPAISLAAGDLMLHADRYRPMLTGTLGRRCCHMKSSTSPTEHKDFIFSRQIKRSLPYRQTAYVPYSKGLILHQSIRKHKHNKRE